MPPTNASMIFRAPKQTQLADFSQKFVMQSVQNGYVPKIAHDKKERKVKGGITIRIRIPE